MSAKASPAGGGNHSPMNVQQANNNFRRAVVKNAIKIVQQLQSISVVPGAQAAYNFTPRNVGLLLGFYIMVSVNMLNTSGTSNLTEFGPANLLSNITFSDFNNYQRINTTGWHVNLVNSAKDRRPFASAVTLASYPIDYANNFQVIKAASTLTTTPGTVVQMLYWVPISYSDMDLRGAIYSAVTGGQMNLQVTPNATPWVASGDATNAVYSGGVGGAYFGNMTIDVYQVFYDQLPTINQNGAAKVVVPQLDLATTYELHQTVPATALALNQENTIAFSNYREFLSTFAVYDNGGTLGTGTDINYWALQAANLLYIFKKEPFLVAADARKAVGTDLPKGTYYFSTREKPINTEVFGNMNLVINPSTVNSNAQVLVGYETFAQQAIVLGAQAFANA